MHQCSDLPRCEDKSRRCPQEEPDVHGFTSCPPLDHLWEDQVKVMGPQPCDRDQQIGRDLSMAICGHQGQPCRRWYKEGSRIAECATGWYLAEWEGVDASGGE